MKPTQSSSFSPLRRLALCLVGWLVLSGAMARAFDTTGYIAQNRGAGREEFFKQFPYDQYLKDVSYVDFNRLQADRVSMYYKLGDGDIFLYKLTAHFAEHNPLPTTGKPVNAWRQRLEIGEAYLRPKPVGRNAGAIYQTIGYFLLGELARSIEAAATARRVHLDDKDVDDVVRQLREHKIHLKIEESEWKKVLAHLQHRDFVYLTQRAKDHLLAHRWLVLLPCLLFGAVGLFQKGWKAKLRAPVGWTCVGIGLYAYLGHLHPSGGITSKLAEQSYRRLTVAGNPNAVTINHLSLGANKIGASIWMDRRSVRAGYMAQDVYQGFGRLRRGTHLAMVAAGGFTNNEGQPEGLTMQQGEIVNAVLLPDRDGLVIVQNDGGIRVLNLKDSELKLPLTPTTVLKIENPLEHIEAYAQLLDWSRQHKATLFQTQLLAFGDKLLISRAKAKPEIRERHILALVSSTNQHLVYHAMFNSVSQCNLADLTEEVYGYIREHHFKVEALLNLDVGAFNILDVFDPNGAQVTSAGQIEGRNVELLAGPKPPEQGTNLLYYNYNTPTGTAQGNSGSPFGFRFPGSR